MYYGARYYLSGLRRFISADTIVPDVINPQAFNRYSYVLNSPTSFRDPTGHGPCDDDELSEECRQLLHDHMNRLNELASYDVSVVFEGISLQDQIDSVLRILNVVRAYANELSNLGLDFTEVMKPTEFHIVDRPDPGNVLDDAGAYGYNVPTYDDNHNLISSKIVLEIDRVMTRVNDDRNFYNEGSFLIAHELGHNLVNQGLWIGDGGIGQQAFYGYFRVDASSVNGVVDDDPNTEEDEEAISAAAYAAEQSADGFASWALGAYRDPNIFDSLTISDVDRAISQGIQCHYTSSSCSE